MHDSLTPADLERIAAEITSDDSPVGIDAKKTHVMILAKLEGLERRLARIEETLAGDGLPRA
jgi:hypothetical protein